MKLHKIRKNYLSMKNNPYIYKKSIMNLGGPGSGRKSEGSDDNNSGGDKVASIQNEISSVDKQIEQIDRETSQAELDKWADTLENELGIKGAEGEKAARDIAERNRIEKRKQLENKKRQLQDDLETENWARSLEAEIGIDPSKAKQYVLPQKGLI